MLNVNKFLQNSRQIDLMGKNFSTYNYDCNKRGNESLNYFKAPNFAMQGKFIAGFETEVENFLELSIKIDDKNVSFSPMRHVYSPAYQDTIYCSESGLEGYEPCGIVSVREEKCILKDSDNFISRLTFYNEGKEDKKIELKLISKCDAKGVYSGKVLPAALGRNKYEVNLYCLPFINDKTKSEIEFTLKSQESLSVIYGICFSTASIKDANKSFENIKEKYVSEEQNNYNTPKFILDNEKLFNDWFIKNVPNFDTDNEDLKKVYYYRWFLLYRNLKTPKDVIKEIPFENEVMYESPAGAWFGCPIGLSVPLHIDEAKWLKTPSVSYSDVLNFAQHYGNYHAYIQYTPMAIWNLYKKYPCIEFIKENYEKISAYTKKQLSKVDESGVPFTFGSWVTGAEYQPSFYEHAEPKWDWLQDNEGMSLGYQATKIYRLDEISYLMQNCYGTAMLAKVVDNKEDYELYYNKYLFIKDYLIKNHYDKDSGLFYDKDEKTGKLCKESLGYDAFALYMSDIFDFDGGIENLVKGLMEESKFLTNFGTTTITKQNPMYWFGNCIVGPTNASVKEPHFYGCCWNGPVWPYATSIVLDGLGSICKKDKKYLEVWLDLFNRYTDLHFIYGDRSVPTIKEHYRGVNGISFSVYHDYFHSLWLDLFFKYYVGINVGEDGISVNSLANEDFSVDGIIVKDKKYKIVKKNNKTKIIEE